MGISGIDDNKFKILFIENYYKKGDILLINNYWEGKVTSTPKRKWYHLLLERITFGLFKATRYYTVKK